MLLGQKSRSKTALKVCAFENRSRPITLSCIVKFINYLEEIIILTRRCVAYKNMSLGQRSRSKAALQVCAFRIRVRPITSSCMVGFKNCLAQIIIKTRRCVACKNYVARSTVKVKAALYVCAFQNRVQPIPSFENWWDLKIIWQE